MGLVFSINMDFDSFKSKSRKGRTRENKGIFQVSMYVDSHSMPATGLDYGIQNATIELSMGHGYTDTFMRKFECENSWQIGLQNVW